MENNAKPMGLYPLNGEVTFIMPNTNVVAKLKEAEPTQTLTSKYMTIEDWQNCIGQEKRVIYCGMKEAIDSSGELYYLVKCNDGAQPFVAAQTVLVQSLQSVKVGQAISITCIDVVKNMKNGKTALFEVQDLGFNIFDKKES